MICGRVIEYTVCGKQARKILFKEIKANRRLRKLKKLIIEVRQLRRQIKRENHA